MGILPRPLACIRTIGLHRCAYTTPRATGSVIDLGPEDFLSELSEEAPRPTRLEKEAFDESRMGPNGAGNGLATGAAALRRRCRTWWL